MSFVPPESEFALAASGAALSGAGFAFAALAAFSGGGAAAPLSAGFEPSVGAGVLAVGAFPGVVFAEAAGCGSGVIDGVLDGALCEAAGVDVDEVVAGPDELLSVLPGACSVIAGFLAEGFSHANPCCFHRKYPNPTAKPKATTINKNFHNPEPVP